LRKLASALISEQARIRDMIAQACKLASERLSKQPRNLGMIAQARKGSNRNNAQPCKFAQPS